MSVPKERVRAHLHWLQAVYYSGERDPARLAVVIAETIALLTMLVQEEGEFNYGS